jgi:hypothetical protein
VSDDAFKLSLGNWFNKEKSPGKWAKAPAYYAGFTYSDFTYGEVKAADEGFVTETPLQVSIICAKTTFALAIDVDYPENLSASAVGEYVSIENAISTHGDHFHILLDMRGVSDADWPQQGRTLWGDIKSSGFIPLPGCQHWSGDLYAETPNWASRIIKATPEIVEALRQDRRDYAAHRLNEARVRNPRQQGVKDPTGHHIYASGYVDGSSAQLPDGFLEHDDELKDLAYDLGTRGFPVDAVFAEWRRLAGSADPANPWTDKDFERHWRRVPQIADEQQAVADYEDAGWRSMGMDPAEIAQRDQARLASLREAQDNQETNPYEDEKPLTTGEATQILADRHNKEVTVAHQCTWIGSFPFEPQGINDTEDAEFLLRRLYPIVRYCIMQDTWIGRQLDRWEIFPIDFSEGLVDVPVRLGLMPKGMSKEGLKRDDIDEKSEEGRKLLHQWMKLQKFGNAGDAGKIARKIKAALRSPISHHLTENLLDMDQDPEEFWAGGVCWDLRACRETLVPRDYLSNPVHLHSAPVLPDENVPTPLWDKLLEAVWPDEHIREWALTCLAAGLTGDPKKIIPVLQGDTNRGKTTVAKALINVLGTYAGVLNPKTIDATASMHDTVLMELMGRRLVFLDEGVKRGQYSTARLKRLAGGGEITANRMHKDPVTFSPTHTLVIAINPDEEMPLADPAIISRIRYIPCDGNPDEVIAASIPLGYFKSKGWLDERAGVLAGMMKRCAALINDPAILAKENTPYTAQIAEADEVSSQDDVLRWFLEASTDCPEGFAARDLFIAFREWTRETKGDRAFIPSEKKFCLRMDELVPEDKINPLKTRLGRLRRRKPLPPGASGFLQVPASPVVGRTTVVQGQPPVNTDVNPPQSPTRHTTHHTPQPFKTPDSSVSVVDVVDVMGKTYVTHMRTHTQGTIGFVASHPSPVTSTTAPVEDPWEDYAYRSELELGHGAPLALDPDISLWPPAAETETPPQVPKPPVERNGDTPPGARTPSKPAKEPAKRTKMTPEERQERLEAKKAETARLRTEKLSASLLELGGPIVSLPAIVLRDQTILPVTARQAAGFLVPFMDELSVDVEHTGYAIGHSDYKLRLVQLGGETAAVVFDPSDPESRQMISGALIEARKLHAHSALADLIPLEHAGLCDASMWDKMDDTVIKAKLTDPKLTDSDESGLKPLAKNLLGADYALSWSCDKLKSEICKTQGWITETETDTPLEKSGWAQMPFNEAFIRYAASDVMDCSAVSRVLDQINPIAPDLLQREQQFIRAFRPIALKGTPLDEAHIDELIHKHVTEREAARVRVETATQGAVTNPKSTTQVPEALISLGYDLPRTKPSKTKPEGGLSAAKGVLEPFAGNILEARELHAADPEAFTIQELTDVEQKFDTLAADILEYRKHDTALGLLLNPWKDLCERGDGRIRSNIMTIEARTGRTSSRNFNMQQVSRRGGMRACILPDPDTRGISADFNSVEVRVGAALSQDEMMMYLIAQSDLYPDRKKEFDFHWRTAITCYGENATKENRYNSKRINFAKMFGSGKQSCANLVGVPVHEVGRAFDAFSAMAPQYEAWDQKMREFVRFGGRSVEAYSGRPLWMDASAEHGAGNTAIQGTARELALDAVEKWCRGPWGSATLLVVHDELVAFNIPAEEAQAATDYLVSCMETELFGVRIKAEANEPWSAWPDAS